MRKFIIFSLAAVLAVFFATDAAMATGKDNDKSKGNDKAKVCFKNMHRYNPHPVSAVETGDLSDVAVLCVPRGEEPKTKKELLNKIITVQIGSKVCKNVKAGKYCIYIGDAGRISEIPKGEIPPGAYEPGKGYYFDKECYSFDGGEECCFDIGRGQIIKLRDEQE